MTEKAGEMGRGKLVRSLISHGEELSCHLKNNGQSLKHLRGQWTWLDLRLEKTKAKISHWMAHRNPEWISEDLLRGHCSSLGERFGDFNSGDNRWRWNEVREFKRH